MDKPAHFFYHQVIHTLRSMLEAGTPDLQWDWERHRVIVHKEGEPSVLRLPLCMPAPPIQAPISRYDGAARPAISLQEYMAQMPEAPSPFLLILIQAGHSAIGYFEGGTMTKHKVIKKYMVRGNGRAQLSYLDSRGKSKAGSRVRLANSVRFFEEINEKLIEWQCTPSAARIFLSCPLRMLTHWFESDPPPPFLRDDPRITKVPIDVHRPDLKQLRHVSGQLCAGFWEGPWEGAR